MAIRLKGAEPTNAEAKAFVSFEIKDAEKGEVEAIVATLGVVDRDEDIIRTGAVPAGAKVVVSAYGHDAVFGKRPVGKGTLAIEGNKLLFKGRIFLATTDGRDTFEVLKEMGPDQEWSFGFRVLGWEVPSEAEKAKGARRILTKLDAFEVSPVIIGAGIGTQTLGVKGAEGAEGASGGEVPPVAPPAPAGDEQPPTPPAPPVDDAAEAARAEAAHQEAVAVKAKEDAGTEFERFQRTLRRLGAAAA